MKFVLLHEGKNDDGIRQFFMDVWELYVKVGGVIWNVEGLLLRRGGIDNTESISYGTHDDPKQHF